MSRGPKPKTIHNSAPGSAPLDRSPLEPTTNLSIEARREFDRLVASISSRGLIGRVDAGHVTMAAILAAELNAILAENDTAANIKTIAQLSSQIRGLRRELGLTTQPSKSLVRPGAFAEPADALAEWRARVARKRG